MDDVKTYLNFPGAVKYPLISFAFRFLISGNGSIYSTARKTVLQETTVQAGIVYKQSLPVPRAVIGGHFEVSRLLQLFLS